MALMMGSLYEALKEGGASDTKAKAAAEEVAGYEGRFAEMRDRFAKVEATQRLHSWMLGVNTALLIAILFRVFWP
jgi:hypothetical protein